ncbi:MAG: hypothetical protein E7658_04100 [Ruminococcaceae bacterium]|nr:hypothetical protein [Oscillospiraceae bacterium]
MEEDLPKRKKLRLNSHDYCNTNAFFVTICTQDRKRLLSEYAAISSVSAQTISPVGEDLDPPADMRSNLSSRGQQYVPPLCLKAMGEIAVEQLLALEKRYPNVKISDYVIMPDHIHAIIILYKSADAATPSLFDIMRVYKSITSRICKQKYHVEKLFQRSYMEHIIRDKEDYNAKRQYIRDNPIHWFYKHMCTSEK